MASPGDKKGRRRGLCGHVMSSFDLHDKCARCREKIIGEDDCVKDKPCSICDGFSEVQRELLATPTYRILKEKKAGLLVPPKEVTVLAPMDDSKPTFTSPVGPSAHPTAQPTSQDASTSTSFVTSEQFMNMSDKWAEQFARMEALLSRGNVLSIPKATVGKVPFEQLISETPFFGSSCPAHRSGEVPGSARGPVKT